MSQQLTAEMVAALAAEAVDGPWHSSGFFVMDANQRVVADLDEGTAFDVDETEANAAFIAAAPAMAHLIETQSEQLVRLQAERDALRKHLVGAVDYFHDTAAISEYHPTPEWVQDWNNYVKCEGCTADILVGHEDQHSCEL